MNLPLYDKIAALDVKSMLTPPDERHDLAKGVGAGVGAFTSASALGKFAPNIIEWISKAPLGTRTRALRSVLAAVGTAGAIGGSTVGGSIAAGRAVPKRSILERITG